MPRLLPLLLLLAGCNGAATIDPLPFTAFVPVYAAMQRDAPVAVLPAKPTTHAGKIYAYGSYTFQIDQYTGIHIIENGTTAQARKIGFLQIPFCTEIAIRANHLYANHNNDIVVLDLSDPRAPREVSRLKGAFPAVSHVQDHPPFSNVYFECPDPAKGMVVDWVQKSVEQPECRR